MATKDKIVNLEDLKVLSDHVEGEVTDLKSDIEDLNEQVFPFGKRTITVNLENVSLGKTNQYIALGAPLSSDHIYNITVDFSGLPLKLSHISTTSGQSGSALVDQLTLIVDGNKRLAKNYQPSTDTVIYLQIQFNSSYTGDLSCNIEIEDTSVKPQTKFDTISEEIDGILENSDTVNTQRPYNLLLSDTDMMVGYAITPSTGSATPMSDKVATGYIEIDDNQEYLCNYIKVPRILYDSETNTYLTDNVSPFDRLRFAFYDENKNFLPCESSTADASKKIPEGAKYVRLTINGELNIPYARLVYGNYPDRPALRSLKGTKTPPTNITMPNTGYENFNMVMFGDSITHGRITGIENGVSYVDYANDILHSNIMSVGFGGTRMTYDLSNAGLFCFYHLCECIVSEDETIWEPLLEYATNTNTSYLPHLQKLMNIDWMNIHAIGVLYGANDYTSNTPVGTSYSTDINKYDGACAYGISLLLQKYPHLQILLLTPFYRQLTLGDESTGSDVSPNTLGLYMKDYADALYNVQEGLHVPIANSHSDFGINKYTIKYMSSDGTHPWTDQGQKRLGGLFANFIQRYLSPQ